MSSPLLVETAPRRTVPLDAPVAAAPRRAPAPAAILGPAATTAAVLLLTACAAATRIWVLRLHDELNADEALPGLMARHIAAGLERPVFFYGQHYFGTAEAYLLAALFRLAGFHPWLLYVLPIAASTLLVPLTYALGASVGGRAGGLCAALPVAAPPPILARLLTNAGGGFSLAFLLHGLLLLCVLRALRSPRHPVAWIALGSLVAGVLIWIWQPAVVLYAVLLLVLIWRVPLLRNVGRLLLAIAPVALGLAPPLLYNARLGWPSVAELAHKYVAPANEASSGPRGDAIAALGNFWLALGGGNEAEGRVNPALAGATLIAIVLTAVLLFQHRGRNRCDVSRWRGRSAAAGVLSLAVLADLVAAHATARHLEPAALAAYALAGGGLGLLARWRWIGGAVVLATLLGAITVPDFLLWQHADETFKHFVARQSEAEAAVQALQGRGLTLGYSDYWSAYPITFLTGESIVVAPSVPAPFGGRFDRYPAYTAQVDGVDDPAHLFLLLDQSCPALPYVLVLDQLGAKYELEQVSRWYLLWDIVPERGEEAETLAAWRKVIYDRQYC